MSPAARLVRLLAAPETARDVPPPAWNDVLTVAKAEQLAAALAHRLDPAALPPRVAAILANARDAAEAARRDALWEAEMVRRALAPLGIAPVLLKGTAFVAAGLDAGQGRMIGDCDVLLPRARLPEAERALLAAGWEWVKDDPYDDLYYRRWMHELPPLIHRERDRVLDVHHTIMPLTARVTPDADALLGAALPLNDGTAILSPADMLIHAALHLLADGDLSGGLRNLWDIDRLWREFAAADPAFALALSARAAEHGATAATERALRLAHRLYATPVPAAFHRPRTGDAIFARAMLARDGWGRRTRPVTRGAFYVRSHMLRMPPALLARHLWIKWRKG